MQCSTSGCSSRISPPRACQPCTHSAPNSTDNTSTRQASIPDIKLFYAFGTELVLAGVEPAVVLILRRFIVVNVRFPTGPVSTLHFSSFRNLSLVISQLLFFVEPQRVRHWHVLNVRRRLRHQILVVYYEHLQFTILTS
jgi:hypothetical protein